MRLPRKKKKALKKIYGYWYLPNELMKLHGIITWRKPIGEYVDMSKYIIGIDPYEK